MNIAQLKDLMKIMETLRFTRNNLCLNEKDTALKKAFDNALIAILAVVENTTKQEQSK